MADQFQLDGERGVCVAKSSFENDSDLPLRTSASDNSTPKAYTIKSPVVKGEDNNRKTV
jgi:hypothetical protein